MDDLLYLGVTVVAFIILWAFVWGCEALRKQ
jgi:nitrogen fixation-related uncharacterized protein